jgi:eukaryotic-like serine/threonine-protein kinase
LYRNFTQALVMNERDIFVSALEIDDSEARRAHLQSACAGDMDLLRRVESLLASHEAKSRFLETPIVEQLAHAPHQGPAATIVAGKDSNHGDFPDGADSVFHGDGPLPPNQDNPADEIPLGYLQPPTRPGSLGRLAHYEILEVVGRGAFGTVLKAFDDRLERVVAIKVMALELAATSPARKRFLREARASAAIRHEYVVSVYAVEETPIPYLVMEYVPGQTLQQRLDEKGPLEVPEVLRLGAQIAEALAAAHARDLIHRDIKPGNILLETGIHERVKITDFGLARAADDASMTQSGMIAGTPLYMAPEQALGHKLDQRADLFSFGSVLYQMVSGRPPFRAPTTLAVLKRVADETPRPISEIIPETPVWLCDIISKLHAKNPDDRYQSAREVAYVLANCEAQLKAHSELKEFSFIPRAKARHRGAWKWVGAAVLVLPLLACGAYTLTHWPQPEAANGKAGNASTPAPKELTADSAADSAWRGWPADAPPPAIAPFDAAKAREHQEAWAKHLGVPVEITNSIGMKLVLIPPGEFMMGSPTELINEELKTAPKDDKWYLDRLPGEGPRHLVRITRPFYLGMYPVTQEEYQRVMGASPSEFSATGKSKDRVTGKDTKQFPVEMVSWQDTDEFCSRLTEMPAEKAAGRWYRLPSEAQWEYACRAGNAGRCFFSTVSDDKMAAENLLPDYAWFSNNSGGQPHAVGGRRASPWGLYDVYGNVWEWCQDWHTNDYYARSPTDDPAGPPGGSRRVFRGGSWFFPAGDCRSAFRGGDGPVLRNRDLGFRVSQVLADK